MHNAKTFFIHAGLLIVLIVTVSFSLTVQFAVINQWLSDKLDLQSYYAAISIIDSIRFAISSLVILLPVYLILVWLGKREIYLNHANVVMPTYPVLGLSKWIMYLIVFITIGIGLGTLSTIVYTFLGGEITARFILKCLALIISIKVAAWYYFDSLRRGVNNLRVKLHMIMVSGLVIASIIAGFSIMGTPGYARNHQFDQRRAEALTMIQNSIDSFHSSNKRLPETLQELVDSGIYMYTSPQDPVTGENLEYRITGNNTYVLCANFATDTTKYSKDGGSFQYQEHYIHPSGNYCFDKKIVSNNEIRP